MHKPETPLIGLSIIILNWNVEKLLVACLASLPEAAGEWWPRAEVIVVDNASTDGSLEMLRARFPDVRVIALPTNRGFTGGNNAGILASRGEYVFLLNPDTVAHPGSIARLASYMDAHQEVGIAGPRLLDPDGTLQPSRRRFPILASALVESTPLEQWFPDAPALRRARMLDRPDGETQSVDWLSGAALMCRRETLWQVGLFDPGYFMFSEEVDLCNRVAGAGWNVAYLPEAEITHYGGRSTGQAVPARHIDFNTSKARYFRIHEGSAAGTLLRYYLLGMSAAQLLSEAAKWLLGHKRPLRAERVRLHAETLRSRLRERKVGAKGAKQTRVLLITGEYPPARGGVGDYTRKLHLALKEERLQAKVLTSRQQKETNSKSIIQNSKFKIQNSTLNMPFQADRITPATVLRALRGSGSRIAHIQYQTGAFGMRPTVNLLPVLLKRKWGGAVAVTFHDLRVPYLFPKAGPLREWANRLLARTADVAIATNQEDAGTLRSWGVRHVRVIPIGSNIPNDPPLGYSRDGWRSAHNISPDTVLLAYFGFLSSTKGLDDLLRALDMLGEQGSFRLMMVGGGLGSSDPTNRATAGELDALARNLGIQDGLIWTGYLSPEEVSAALLSADMAVLPYADGASFRRGSLLAALEHNLPVVTTVVSGQWSVVSGQESKEIPHSAFRIPQLIDGENALLVPAGDGAALAQAILRLAGDERLRARLIKGSTELARFFRWEHIAKEHNRLYEDIHN